MPALTAPVPGHYGAFAGSQTLYRQVGITAAAALDGIRDARAGTRPGRHIVILAPAADGTADHPA